MKKMILVTFGCLITGLNCLFAQEQDCKYPKCIQVFDARDPKKFFEEVSSDTISFVPFTDPTRKSPALENPITRADFKVEALSSEGDTVEVSIYGIYYPTSFEFFWNFPDTANDLKTIAFDRKGFMTNFFWYKMSKNNNRMVNLRYSVDDSADRDLEKIVNYVEEGKKFLFLFDVKLQIQRELAEIEKAFPLRR